MRKTLIAGLIAASLLPVAVQAKPPHGHGEGKHDKHEVREERRELKRAYRSGDKHVIRHEREDLREARRDYRDTYRGPRGEWGRDDWRAYRDRNRDLYRAYGWRSEYRYQQFRPGLRIGNGYYGPRYVIADPSRYRLPRPGYGQNWVRHYNDVVLVDTRRGIVVDVIRSFYI